MVYPYGFGVRPDHELSDWNQNKENFDSEFFTPDETPRDMPDLVSRESAEQKKMEGIKTLAPNQMLSRLSISLA